MEINMLKSMTGFGKSSRQTTDWSISWEIRSVNSRHLDLKWRIPLFLRSMETRFEKILRKHAARGRVELTLQVKITKPELLGISLNRPLAGAMINEMREFSGEIGLSGWEPDLNRLLSISHLWDDDSGAPDPTLVENAEAALEEALTDWNRARSEEGAALKVDLLDRIGRLEEGLSFLVDRTPQVKEERFAQLESRIQTVLDRFEIEADEARMLQEIAVLSDRLDVSEELTRLRAHLDQLAKLMENGKEAGKRLDFTLQECFREINTCGNKAQDTGCSRIVVEFKAELEKCREQVQNIE